MGGGISFVYAMFAGFLITRFGWRQAYFVLGAILIVVLLPLLFFFFYYHPKDKGFNVNGTDDSETYKSSATDIGGPGLSDWTFDKVMKSYQLWLLVSSQFFHWGLGSYLILGHQVKLAEDAGYSAMFAVSIFGLYGVFMIAGQLSSSISDWIGRELTIACSSVLTVVALIALLSVKDTSQPWLLYVYAICFGYGSGLYSPTIFAGAADIFYGRHFGAINGLILAGMGVGGAIGPWLGGYIYDIWGSYDFAIILCMVCFVLSGLTFIIAAPRNAHKIRLKLA
jgi:MFS family permease